MAQPDSIEKSKLQSNGVEQQRHLPAGGGRVGAGVGVDSRTTHSPRQQLLSVAQLLAILIYEQSSSHKQLLSRSLSRSLPFSSFLCLSSLDWASLIN